MDGAMENGSYINARQIKAARALLDWSQEDLAAATDLSVNTIRKIESGHISPRGSTMGAIAQAIGNAGAEFSGTSGVKMRDEEVITREGEHCLEEFMEKIYNAVKGPGGEVLYMHADMTRASQKEIDILILLKKRGIKLRRLCEEGDTYLNFPIEEFRWIPKKYFKPSLQVIYEDYVAVCIYPDSKMRSFSKMIVIRNKYLAEAIRNDFNFYWDNCRMPTHSTAEKIYD
jgi:transcriptional regulator with XRE-family HTH domain